MQERTIEGRGMLTCAGAETPVTYKINLLSDHTGDKAAGVVRDLDEFFTLIAFQVASAFHLVLEDGRKMAVRIVPHGDGTADVHTSGPIPDPSS